MKECNCGYCMRGELLDKLDLHKGDLVIKDKDANLLYNSRVWNGEICDMEREVIRVYCDFDRNVCYIVVL